MNLLKSGSQTSALWSWYGGRPFLSFDLTSRTSTFYLTSRLLPRAISRSYYRTSSYSDVPEKMIGGTNIMFLPQELLEKIFHMGALLPLPVDDHYPHRPLFSKLPYSHLYAISISQVCARWRETALHIPTLWCFIHLTRSLYTHRHLRSDLGRSLEWLPIYLSRSRNLPLHITLDTTRLPADAALSLVIPYSTRWCRFTLLVSHVGSLPPILPLLVRTLVPRLQCLAIISDIYREGIVCYDHLVPFFVTGTPQLSTIRLKGVYVAWNALPLANLRNLELHLTSRWPNFDQLQDMFDASPMLQRLIIYDDIASILRHVNQPASKPTVELAALNHFEIEVFRVRDERADIAGLLGIFNLPVLQALVIKGVTPEEWISVTDYFDLPVRAFPVPIQHRGRSRLGSRRLPRSFPFLSHLTVTSAPPSPTSFSSRIR